MRGVKRVVKIKLWLASEQLSAIGWIIIAHSSEGHGGVGSDEQSYDVRRLAPMVSLQKVRWCCLRWIRMSSRVPH